MGGDESVMTPVILSQQHTDACAKALEDWIEQWNRDYRAEKALELTKRRWDKATAECPGCRSENHPCD